jgi:hypothetical protein
MFDGVLRLFKPVLTLEIPQECPRLRRVVAEARKRQSVQDSLRYHTAEIYFRFIWKHWKVPNGSAVDQMCKYLGLHKISPPQTVSNPLLKEYEASAGTIHVSSSFEDSPIKGSLEFTTDAGSSTESEAEHAPATPQTFISVFNNMQNNENFSAASRFTLMRNQHLGKGAFGTVFKGFDLLNGRYCAVKEALIPRDKNMRKRSSGFQEELRKEFDVLVSLKHPHIVEVVGLEVTDLGSRIYMEWMPTGSVATLIRQTGPLPEAVVKRYLVQLLSALEYIHARGILHRDIKPGNILLTGKGVPKLSDFGTVLSTGDSEEAAHGVTGTVPYMSPEVLEGQYSSGTDMWALALTVNEMLTGKVPWSETGLSGAALMFHISRAKPPQNHPPLCETMSPQLSELLLQCLDYDERLRPTAAQLLSSPYFDDVRHFVSP